MLGAVNCVVNRRGVLRGDNTDARGLERDLRDLGCELRGRLAIVIGAGGGAASSVLTCIRLGASRVVIANRTPSRAAALARRFSAKGARAAGEPRGLDALMDSELLADARLIVNATSMGLTTGRFARLDYDSTPADCLFYDLIYSRGADRVHEACARRRPECGRRRRDAGEPGRTRVQALQSSRAPGRRDARSFVRRAGP